MKKALAKASAFFNDVFHCVEHDVRFARDVRLRRVMYLRTWVEHIASLLQCKNITAFKVSNITFAMQKHHCEQSEHPHSSAAKSIAFETGIDEVIANVLPADKEKQILCLQNDGKKVATVGDGINDAPALISTDVGIAIGAGTDIAVDSADIVLMKNDLYDIVTNALRLRFFKAKKPNLKNFENNEKTIKQEDENTSSVKGLENMKTIINVEGMMCGHCKAHVENALMKIDGVESAVASVENKTAEVTLSKDVDRKILVDAIVAEGYKAE